MKTITPATTRPSISIVIPCFRSGHYLIQSVSSVLSQQGNFNLVEILIVDDGSDDLATMDAYSVVSLWDKVVVMKNQGSKGSAGARNTAIKHAKGDWIAFLDADDWWPDNSLASRLQALKDYPDAQWIGGDFLEYQENGNVETIGRFRRNLEAYHFLRPAFQEEKTIRLTNAIEPFLHQTPTNTIVTLIKRSLLLQIGLFDEKLLRQQDLHLFLRLANTTDFIFIPEVVAFYRLHDSNSTRSLTQTQSWRITALKDLTKNSDFQTSLPVLKKQIALLYLSNSYVFRRQGDFANATANSLRSVWAAPTLLSTWKSFVASILHLS